MYTVTHDITVRRERRGLGHPRAERFIEIAAEAALRCEGIAAPCHIDALLTGRGTIRRINKSRRGVDSVTDVLSFPMNALEPGKFDAGKCERDMNTGYILLGDIALCVPKCETQGIEYGHGFARELCYLTVHSVLHLLGYDHLDEGEDKARMRAREKFIMDALGLLPEQNSAGRGASNG